LIGAFRSTHIRENAVRDIALGRQSVPDGLNIATLCPDENEVPIERTTRDTQILKQAAIASASRTLAAFGHVVQDFIEVLRPYPAVAGDDGALDSESDDSTLAAA
jgi:hypothetical protein